MSTHTPQGTEAAVCADIARRQAMGIEKYGTTVSNNPLPLKAWLQHAYEETLDQAIYLKRAIEEQEKLKEEWHPIATAPRDGTHIRCRMKGGILHEDVHWGENLSGEEQPIYRGWFIPTSMAVASASRYAFREIDTPVEWQPRP